MDLSKADYTKYIDLAADCSTWPDYKDKERGRCGMPFVCVPCAYRHLAQRAMHWISKIEKVQDSLPDCKLFFLTTASAGKPIERNLSKLEGMIAKVVHDSESPASLWNIHIGNKNRRLHAHGILFSPLPIERVRGHKVLDSNDIYGSCQKVVDLQGLMDYVLKYPIIDFVKNFKKENVESIKETAKSKVLTKEYLEIVAVLSSTKIMRVFGRLNPRSSQYPK